MEFLGADFIGAGWLLVYFSLFAFVPTMSRSFDQVGTGTGKLKRALRMTAQVLASNSVLNLILIPDTEMVPRSFMCL